MTTALAAENAKLKAEVAKLRLLLRRAHTRNWRARRDHEREARQKAWETVAAFTEPAANDRLHRLFRAIDTDNEAERAVAATMLRNHLRGIRVHFAEVRLSVQPSAAD